VRLRVKVNPWFISDTTTRDIDWMLGKLIDGAINDLGGDGKNDTLRSQENDADLEKLGALFQVFLFCQIFLTNGRKFLGTCWSSYIRSGKWEVLQDPFWTYPHSFRSFLLQISPCFPFQLFPLY